jgi:RNA polymerase sigma factor (sigma-70 family)
VRIRSEADAEDVVQNAFLAARRFYPEKGEEELRPLLFTLVRNFSLNRLTVLARQRRLEDIASVGRDIVCERSATPERQVMDAQLLSIAEDLIAAMPERRREALRLHRFEGLTYAEIAARLSVSPATAKNDVADAVAELAEGLARAGRPAE